MIRQGDGAQVNYRRSETLPDETLNIGVSGFIVELVQNTFAESRTSPSPSPA